MICWILKKYFKGLQWGCLVFFVANKLGCCRQVASVMSNSVRPHRQQPTRSLGFSRQEHWSGLPFPSPMHESEK